jgi:hypothetical protein
MKTLSSRIAALVAALSLLPAAFAQDAAKPADAAPAPKAPKAHKAAKAEKAKPADEGVAKAGKPYPFHGTVVSVDKKAMTFTVEGKDKPRVIGLGSHSILEKDGKPATLSLIAAGDHVQGRVAKSGEDEVVVKASIGVKTAAKAGGDEPKPKKKAKKAKKAHEAPETTPAPAPVPAPASDPAPSTAPAPAPAAGVAPAPAPAK